MYKFTAKSLTRQAKKTEKDAEREKLKVKKAIQAQNMQVAKIYAENVIRKNSEALQLIKLSSRVDAVAARVQTAVTMNQISRNMATVVVGMDRAMKSMNLDQISRVMDKFETQFEDLDVRTGVMESSVGGVVASSVPVDQVDSLLKQVADEAGLEFNQKLGVSQVPSDSLPSDSISSPENSLSERLAKLRNSS
ncbi:Vacuolar protein-sorting-associated protein 46 [Smittium mucronatum]|uniref:Vacuolar protein-sorting-associated protein 46 n=1 Tax=Smittium mucronatum TaxID=133383 RepID=A0A1R0H885_9FUNG|nr:Vacuolar protein-sorting-associated protein 46 [Smittium mucronatum]